MNHSICDPTRPGRCKLPTGADVPVRFRTALTHLLSILERYIGGNMKIGEIRISGWIAPWWGWLIAATILSSWIWLSYLFVTALQNLASA